MMTWVSGGAGLALSVKLLVSLGIEIYQYLSEQFFVGGA